MDSMPLSEDAADEGDSDKRCVGTPTKAYQSPYQEHLEECEHNNSFDSDDESIYPHTSTSISEVELELEDPPNNENDRPPFRQRLVSFIVAFGKRLLSYWVFVLIFVPASLATFLVQANPLIVFTTNSLAIIPLSALLADATEMIAENAGAFVGAIWNVSLGNLVELIMLVALRNGKIQMVQASILGSILVNLLLILGSAIVAGSMLDSNLVHNTTETQLLGCLLYVSVFTFLIPTAFNYSFADIEGADKAVLQMSRLSALIILATYILYFVHQLRPSPSDHDSIYSNIQDVERSTHIIHPPPHIHRTSADAILLPQRSIQFADENINTSTEHISGNDREITVQSTAESSFLRNNGDIHTGVEEGCDRPRGRSAYAPARSRGVSAMNSYPLLFNARRRSRSISLASSSRRFRNVSCERATDQQSTSGSMRSLLVPFSCDSCRRRHETTWLSPRVTSIVVLITSSALMSVCAEILVGTVDDVVRNGHLSESMIGLIILPVVGNVAELVTVVSVATRNKMDLAIGVSVGSSIQIALCLAPLTILAGWAMGQDLPLTFNVFEMAALVGTALLVNFMILNGRTSGLKGSLMCACYVIVGIGSYLAPKAGESKT